MLFRITEMSGDGFTQVTTEHKGHQLVWNTKIYIKVRLLNTNEVFGGINQYIATLPDVTQDALFECYRDIKECLDETMDAGSMIIPLKDSVEQIYTMIPMDHLHHWMMTQYYIYMPPDVQDTVEEGDRYPNRDETYTKEDYYNLATYSLALRFMIPIWGEYIAQGGGGTSDDLYKEMDAASLLTKTELVQWPTVSNTSPMTVHDKLQRYIQIKVGNTEVDLANLLKGIGSVEIPIRLRDMVMVRRLTIAPLSDQEAAHNLVANVYHYVGNKLKPNERRAGNVAPKRNDGEGRDEDDKTSMLEEYKIKRRVTDGDDEALRVDTQRMAILAQVVDPSIDLQLLEKTTANLNKLTRVMASDHQIYLAQWALQKAFSPRGFGDIDNLSVNRLLVTAQALYWHWGFTDIAVTLTVDRVMFSAQNIPGLNNNTRVTSRFTKHTQDTMMELFPHFFPQSGKDANDRKGNVGLIGIGTVFQELFSANWQYYGPNELHRVAGQPQGMRTLVISPTIKQSLADAATKITLLNQ